MKIKVYKCFDYEFLVNVVFVYYFTQNIFYKYNFLLILVTYFIKTYDVIQLDQEWKFKLFITPFI